MSKLLIDTNIVIDLLSGRKPFCESAEKLFSLADKNKIHLSISSLTFANTNYILSKLRSAKEARSILRKFKVLIKIAALNDKIIDLALNDDGFNDFEDGLQYYTAVESGCEVLITRNLRDFKNAKIPVMTAEEYLVSV